MKRTRLSKAEQDSWTAKKSCPFCKSMRHRVGSFDDDEPNAPAHRFGYKVVCNNCGAAGPIMPSRKEAKDAWDSENNVKLQDRSNLTFPIDADI